jgi:hypothetical protein
MSCPITELNALSNPDRTVHTLSLRILASGKRVFAELHLATPKE